MGRGHQEEHRVILTTPKRLGALALVATIALGACSSSGGSAAPSAAAPSAAAPSAAAPSAAAPSAAASTSASAAAVTGTINVSGSSTVEPISTAVAELVKKANAGFNYTVTGPGTGDGFKTFCKGETDISDASRKIKDEEAATCKAAGIEYTELKIAYRRPHGHDLTRQQRRDLPVVRRPVRADRPTVSGLRQVVRGGDARKVSRLEYGLPGH